MFRVINAIMVISCILLVIISCKKEEEVDLCSDGFQSIGETGIDCGGACAPCPEVVVPYAEGDINGESTPFNLKSLTRPDKWYFNFGNDSINIVLNFGSGDSLGTRPLSLTGNSASYNGQSYSTFLGGDVLFTNIDHTNNRLSGFCEAQFRAAVGDTLKIENVEFSDISWD